MKTKSHNCNSKPSNSHSHETDELITVHKSSIILASMQMAQLIDADTTNHMLLMQHSQQITGIQQPCIPTINFSYATLVPEYALEIEKQNFSINKED